MNETTQPMRADPVPSPAPTPGTRTEETGTQAERAGESAVQAFTYLLNGMERAAQSGAPHANGYGDKRAAVLAYVRGLAERASASEPSTRTEEADEAIRRDAMRWRAIRSLLGTDGDVVGPDFGPLVEWPTWDEEQAARTFAHRGIGQTVEELVDAVIARSPEAP